MAILSIETMTIQRKNNRGSIKTQNVVTVVLIYNRSAIKQNTWVRKWLKTKFSLCTP